MTLYGHSVHEPRTPDFYYTFFPSDVYLGPIWQFVPKRMRMISVPLSIHSENCTIIAVARVTLLNYHVIVMT